MNTYIVNEPSKNIRTLARQALSGHWKSAVLAMLVYLLCIAVPTVIIIALFGGFSEEALINEDFMSPGEGLSTIYSILVTGAFTFGITVYFLDLVREKKADLGQVFSGFGFFFKTLLLYIVMSIFIVLWSLLLIVPGIIASFRYSQAFYILADDPSKDVMQCIKESKEMMKGNKAKYFCLQLSFIGWYLLFFAVYLITFLGGAVISIMAPGAFALSLGIMGVGLVALIIGGLILMPYVMAATTVFYEMANGNLRPESDELPPLSQNAFDDIPVMNQEPVKDSVMTESDINEYPELNVDNNSDSVNNDKIEL